MASEPYLEPGFIRLSPHFEYDVGRGLGRLVFDWDGVAVGPGSELVLIEKELSRPVVLHVQGHASRAAFMLSRGERIRKLVWIVREQDFQALWHIVEPWRAALAAGFAAESPVCEYWTPEGICLAMSLRTRSATPDRVVLSESRVSPVGGLQ